MMNLLALHTCEMFHYITWARHKMEMWKCNIFLKLCLIFNWIGFFSLKNIIINCIGKSILWLNILYKMCYIWHPPTEGGLFTVGSWCYRSMCSLISHSVLHTDSPEQNNTHCAEPECLALCVLSNQHYYQVRPATNMWLWVAINCRPNVNTRLIG